MQATCGSQTGKRGAPRPTHSGGEPRRSQFLTDQADSLQTCFRWSAAHASTPRPTRMKRNPLRDISETAILSAAALARAMSQARRRDARQHPSLPIMRAEAPRLWDSHPRDRVQDRSSRTPHNPHKLRGASPGPIAPQISGKECFAGRAGRLDLALDIVAKEKLGIGRSDHFGGLPGDPPAF